MPGFVGRKAFPMESFVFALNAVAPIIIIVALGYFLKKIGWFEPDFAKKVNKLVFHVFLPAMLFLNVYKIENISGVKFGFVLYAVIGVLVIFAAALPAVMLVTKKGERRGVLLQASFRSNYALVGIPLAEMLFGEGGVLAATLLSAAVVPLLNILGVVSLSLFGDGGRPNIKKILLGVAKNPLIGGVALGAVALFIRAMLMKNGIAFRLSDVKPVYTVLEYLSRLATPLALLALGAQFDFSAVSKLRREIIFGTLVRVAVVPLLGIGIAYFGFRSGFEGAHFAALIAVFATPVSVSSVPMTQEMGGDYVLAGQLVIWSTLFSTVSVFLASFLLKLAGVF